MTDDTPKSDDKSQDDVLEVTTDVGPFRMKSRAEIVEQDDGSVSFAITGPFLEFIEPDDEDSLDETGGGE